jgi:hypothetical protein
MKPANGICTQVVKKLPERATNSHANESDDGQFLGMKSQSNFSSMYYVVIARYSPLLGAFYSW